MDTAVTTREPGQQEAPTGTIHSAREKRAMQKAILRETAYKRYPRFWEALKEDVRVFCAERKETAKLDSPLAILRAALKLSVDTDAFCGLVLYRARTRLLVHGVPILPNLIHRVCIACFQMNIGEPVVLRPGVYVPHGQFVLDGDVTIGKEVTLGSWVCIGLLSGGLKGPNIGDGVFIGGGSQLLGEIVIGSGAHIGANSVVVKDVPASTAVAGVPARPV